MHCWIEEQLSKIGLRKTKDRHAILELFDQDRTWTAAQLAQVLPEVDLSTIYRNLTKLVEKNLIQEVHSHDGESHFERAGRQHHDHLVCENCHVVECVPCPVRRLPNHVLELNGLCATCR